MKKQGAVAPLSHRLDTSSRVEQPKHDWGSESAAHVRQLEDSGQEKANSMRMNVRAWCGTEKVCATHSTAMICCGDRQPELLLTC